MLVYEPIIYYVINTLVGATDLKIPRDVHIGICAKIQFII